MAKNRSGAGAGASFKRILLVVGILAIAGYLAVSQANKVMTRALELAFDDIEVERKGAWFDWSGNIHADGIALYLDEDATQVVRFRRAQLETPGWLWLAQTAFHPKRRAASLTRVQLTLSDGLFENTEPVTLYELDPFTLDTGMPFAADGCVGHNDFRHAQLASLGLAPGAVSLDFDYRIEGGKVLRTITLDTPGVSRLRYERTESFANIDSALLLDNLANALHLDAADTQVLAEQWQVQDAGFVQARNAFCAKEDGIDVAQFEQRHLDTVTRVLDASGVSVDDATRTRYATFARDGGTLVIDLRYRQPVDVVDFHEGNSLDGGALAFDATLALGAQRGPIAIATFDARPLAGYGTGDTPAYALLERELALAAPATPAAPGVPRSDAQRGVYKVFADPMAARADDAPQSTANAVSAMAPAAAPVAAPPVAATVSPPSSTPTATAPPAVQPAPVAASLPAPALPVARELVWSDLARYKGQRMRVWTRQSPARNVELLEVGSGQIRVKALLGGGHAHYSISRQNFARAKLLD